MTLAERRQKWEIRKAKRRAALIKKVAITGTLVLIPILAVILFIVLFGSKAEARQEKPLYKYYTSIEVQYGDTLTSIAKEHTEGYSSVREYVEEVKFMNSLKSADEIKCGQILYIPYYSTEWK